MRKDRLFGNLILMLTALIWGTAFAFQRAGMEQIGPLTFVASRMTLSAAAVGLAALLRGRHAPRQKTESRADIRRTVTGGICCGMLLVFRRTSIIRFLSLYMRQTILVMFSTIMLPVSVLLWMIATSWLNSDWSWSRICWSSSWDSSSICWRMAM